MSENEEDDFARTSSNFMSWLQQRGISVSPKISLADLRDQDAGRGVVAMEDIEEGEVLFALPLTDVLSVETSALQQLLAQEVQELDEWLSLVLVLIYEYGQGEKSPWRPYLDILPSQFDTLAYWTPQELAELQGSAVVKKIGREGADEFFRTRLLPIVKAYPDIFGENASAFKGGAAESVLLRLAHRTATLIMAYAFDLEAEKIDEDSEEADSQYHTFSKGMVPLADMLNADGDNNNAHLVQQADSLHMVALKSIKKREEIYNDYGQLPRSDLLRRYGYITDEYKKWDVVEINSDLIIRKACGQRNWNDSSKSKRFELVEKWEVNDDAFDISRHAASQLSTLNPALQMLMDAFTMAPPALNEEIGADEVPGEPRFTLEVANVLLEVLTERRRDYKSSAAEDVALLQGKALSKRRRLAVEVRLGEKEIIARTMDTLCQQIRVMELQKIGSNSEWVSLQDLHEDESRPSKRKKV